MKETELYAPVKKLFLSQGFDVKGEVKDIDVIAYHQDLMIGVELKTKVSLKLIYQAIDRQKVLDQVYIAIPKDAIYQSKSLYRNFTHLLKRLEIGLIIVNGDSAEVIIEAVPFDRNLSRSRYKKRKTMLDKELRLRKNNKNIGGTNGKKITRYKEQVIDIGNYLISNTKASPKEIKEKTGIEKAASILQKNYDGYFERVERGIYQLTEKGKKDIIKLKKQLEESI
ncbi:hypothetical protein BK010_08955 [Tenericutes bacterium MO-XQ]|nr:hypothetical protein BK010_08445 [Tenericutes bacterium MO-XQ]AUD63711.1 hypothetical protein BK010_08955 [Tenericutes bacterium MO-XQ]